MSWSAASQTIDQTDTRNVKLLVCGANQLGQTGVANGEDLLTGTSTALASYVDTSGVSRVVCSAKQSFLLFQDGSIYSCGSNDAFELARSGKRSIFQRIDSIERYSVIDAAIGENFVLLVTKEGKLIGWGVNEYGQLGCGDREFKDKPKLNNYISEGIVQIAAGSQHVVALTTSGSVITFGGNKRGQLGSGQLTSSCTPLASIQLRHRPVISVACGESHSLALTVGGNVYAWGENSQGQLGLGDNTPRLRAEVVRSLRTARIVKISAGKQHTMAISKSGLLFAFGSNSFGQLGIGANDVRSVNIPTVVERLRELKSVDVTCSSGSSFVIVERQLESSNITQRRVYAMGLNSSGQLGIENTTNHFSPVCIPLPPLSEPVGFSSGPLSMATFILLRGSSCTNPSLPSVELMKCVDYERSRLTGDVNSFRLLLAAVFSSIAALNSSFRTEYAGNYTSTLSIDLQAVRTFYNFVTGLHNETIANTLGRATLQLSDHLKECPWDDAENLSVFLIVLENPLLLKPIHSHITIERIISGILALPKSYRVMLFSWLKSYPSEYFSRILQVFQGFLSFCLSCTQGNIDPAPVIIVLNSLYECNKEVKIVPNDHFYNMDLTRSSGPYSNILQEWNNFKGSTKDSKVFNVFSYPFLLHYEVKNMIMHNEFFLQQSSQATQFLYQLFYSLPEPQRLQVLRDPDGALLPRGIRLYVDTQDVPQHQKVKCCLELRVHRESLLADVIDQLNSILVDNREALKLPLNVTFIGEDAIDQGGVKKELLTLAIRKLILDTGILLRISSTMVWFNDMDDTARCAVYPSAAAILSHFPNPNANHSANIAHILGVLVGLAAYNTVLIDIPLPSSIYKVMTQTKLSLEDIWEADESLAKSLKTMLSEEDYFSDIYSDFNFTVSVNPLLANCSDHHTPPVSTAPALSRMTSLDDPTHLSFMYPAAHSRNSYIELKANGNEISLTKSNRQEFVDLFVNWSLYGSCQPLIDSYISGIKELFTGQAVDLCTNNEIEILLNGSKEIGDLSELRLRTRYQGEYSDEHPIINWFWDVLSSMSSYRKLKFLHFVTGSPRIPVGGISKLGLIIQSTQQSNDALCSSHTCFNILNIPVTYPSKEHLKERLYASLEYTEGFGFA